MGIGLSIGMMVGSAAIVAAVSQIVPDAARAVQAYTFADAGGTQTVYLRFPAAYDETDDAASWPVYVYLHGKGGSQPSAGTSWLARLDEAIAAGQIDDGIVVLPSYGTASWWVDSKDGTSPSRTKLNALRARLLLATRASSNNAHWHLHGYSMGAWGSASWFAADPSAWGSLALWAPPNWDATQDNYWAGNDAADFVTIFGSDQAYLESLSPGQLWTTNAAAIIASGVPIRLALGSLDGVSSASVARARVLLAASAIPYGYDTVTGADHVTYFGGLDSTLGAAWIGATQYSYHTDPLCKAVVHHLYSDCYVNTAGTITSLVNRVTSTSASLLSGPTHNATGLNGKPCRVYNGTSQHAFGTDAAWTDVVSGTDKAWSEYWVFEAATVAAIQTLGGYTSSASNTPFQTTGTIGTSRLRQSKNNDAAVLVSPSGTTEVAVNTPYQLSTRCAGTTGAMRLNRAAYALTSSDFGSGAITLNRWCEGARALGAGPTVGERMPVKVGARLLYETSVSDSKNALIETKLRQEFLLTASG